MSVVIDANLLVVLVSSESRRVTVREKLRFWAETDEQLHAPSLLPYEVANGLTRLVVAGQLDPDQIRSAWQTILATPITYHPLLYGGERMISIARQLGRTSAYDAAYLVLTQDLGAELWTLDGPLARNATGLGYPVHLLG